MHSTSNASGHRRAERLGADFPGYCRGIVRCVAEQGMALICLCETKREGYCTLWHAGLDEKAPREIGVSQR